MSSPPPHAPPASVRERGAVTAETAIALPVVLIVLAAVLLVGSASATQMRCLDAARAGARVAALGQPDDDVAAVARRVAGVPAAVVVERDPPWVEVTVTAPVTIGGWGGALRASATAVAHAEP